MDIEQFMKDRSLFGMISEPSPYYWERVKKAIEDAYEQGHDDAYDSEYGTGGGGIPLTPEETKKFWEDLPKQMAEKYKDTSWLETYLEKYTTKPI